MIPFFAFPPEVRRVIYTTNAIENLMAWLNPDANNLDAQQALLDDRERPYYQHYLEAA